MARPTRMRARLSVSTVTVVLFACACGTRLPPAGTSAPSGVPSRTARPAAARTAHELCTRATLPPRLLSATDTTVGELRAWQHGFGLGPPYRPTKNGWPRAAATEAGAWCWTGTLPDTVAWAVGPDATAVRIVAFDGPASETTVPHGPPVYP